MVWWMFTGIASQFAKPIAYAAMIYVGTMIFLPELNADINQIIVDFIWNNFKDVFVDKAKEEIL